MDYIGKLGRTLVTELQNLYQKVHLYVQELKSAFDFITLLKDSEYNTVIHMIEKWIIHSTEAAIMYLQRMSCSSYCDKRV